MAGKFEEQYDEEDPLYAGKASIVGVRMPEAMRKKLERLAEAEGRMVTPSAMIRLLVKRANEPGRKKS
jgi:hypothetical protein